MADQGKRRLGCIRWFLMLLTPIGLFFSVKSLLPNPAIRIGPNTTRITAPLDANGHPDYVRYIDEKDREGVTSENNAAVLIWQAMWPGALEPLEQTKLCEALDIQLPDALQSVDIMDDRRFLATILGKDEELDFDDRRFVDVEESRELQSRLGTTPWTSDQVPQFAAWMEDNQKPINLIVEGAARPKYYSPRFVDSRGMLMAKIPDSEMLRSACRVLRQRAMWHIGEERPMAAWRDIYTMFLLARHASASPSLVERLVGVALEAMACTSTRTLVDRTRLSREQLLTVQSDIAALPSLPGVATAIDGFERMAYLDAVLRLASGDWEFEDMGGPLADRGKRTSSKFRRLDWNIALELGNDWFDQAVGISQLPLAERRIESDRFEEDIHNLAMSPKKMVGSLFSTKMRSQAIGGMLVTLLLPAVNAAANAGDRAHTDRQLTEISIALQIYHSEQSHYPATLEELVPKYFPEMPIDRYSGNSYIYEKRNDGFLLYSVFNNGKDDGGDHFDNSIVDGEWSLDDTRVRWEKSDIVVRFPQLQTAFSTTVDD